MSTLALALWLLGYPDQARRKLAESLTEAELIGDPLNFSVTLFFAELLYRHMGEVKLLASVLEKLRALYAQHAIWTARLESMALQGWLAVQQGEFAQSIGQIRAEIDAFIAAGHTMFQTHRLGLLIEAQLKAGQFADAWATLEEAFAISEQSGQRSFDAELYRLKGELLRHLDGAEADIALAYEQAIQLAHTQSAKSLELRATVSLGRLWQRQGKRAEARQLLTEIYGWFTEGFDTADLQAAKALLDELSS